MLLPSKELLSAVLGIEVEGGIERIVLNDNTLTFAYSDEDMWSDINIYELMHMMKEWAISKKVYILSNISFIGGTAITLNGSEDNLFVANTELEAVTIACEWILEQQK